MLSNGYNGQYVAELDLLGCCYEDVFAGALGEERIIVAHDPEEGADSADAIPIMLAPDGSHCNVSAALFNMIPPLKADPESAFGR